MMNVPEPSKRRLVQTLQFLQNCKKDKVTSAEISSALSCKDTLVRYDLRFVSCNKGVSNGYNVTQLKAAICDICNLTEKQVSKNCRNCCIFGLGRLGAALLDETFFDGSGFKVVAGFDSNVNRTEILRSTFPLYPASKFETVAVLQNIECVILCVAEKDAQLMAERIAKVESVHGIVNFTATPLIVPKTLKVENVSPLTALLNLSSSFE